MLIFNDNYSISFHGEIVPSEPGPPHQQGFTITLRHRTR